MAGSPPCRRRRRRCSAPKCWRRCRWGPKLSCYVLSLAGLAFPDLEDALAAVSEGRRPVAIPSLKRLDGTLTDLETTETAALRGSILVISEVLTEHRKYFDIGV